MSNNLGLLFKQIRKKHKFSQSDFTEIVARPTIARFEAGQAELSSIKLFRCLEKMSVDVAEIYALNTANRERPNTYLPVYDLDELRYKRRKEKGFISYPKGASSDSYAVRVVDCSMNTEGSCFPIGCCLIVEPTSEASSGDLVIVSSKHRHYFRRLVADNAVPDNDKYDTINGANVVGRVVGTIWMQ